MDTISVPRRHSSCSMNNSITPPRSPTFLINRASPIPDENTFYGTIIEGLGGSFNINTCCPIYISTISMYTTNLPANVKLKMGNFKSDITLDLFLIKCISLLCQMHIKM